MDISADQVRVALLSLIAFVVSVSVHEFGHAFVADKLGDRIPRLQGRLTLSPLAHIDPLGTILMPLLGALLPGQFPLLAWGKPVQTNPNNYTAALPRRTGHLLVSLAGPLMNLLLAVVVSVVFVALGKAGLLSPALGTAMIRYLLALNIALLFFNLIPVPPLDGGAILGVVLPESLQFITQALRRYGVFVLLILFMTGAIRVFMRPAMYLTEAWAKTLLGLIGVGT
jgi:Zn-dependent protease